MSKRTGFVTFIVASLLLNALGGVAWAALPAGQPAPSVTETADGVVVEWRVPPLSLETAPDGGPHVAAPGFARTSQPGWPDLPLSAVVLAVPPGGTAALEIEALSQRSLPLTGPLATLPGPAGVARAEDGSVLGGEWQAVPALAFDRPVVELEPLGVVRGVNLARLVFYPARPEGGALTVTDHLRVRIRMNWPAGVAASAASGGLFWDLAAPGVANPGQLLQAMSAAPTGPLLAPAAALAADAWAVEVTQAGITAITYEALASAGYPVGSVNPHHLRLHRDGQEHAMEWVGDGDAQFEPGERLLFFADPRFSRWTAADTYFLTVSGSNGLRMASRSAEPAALSPGRVWVKQLFEQNNIYTPDCYCGALPAGHDGDRWAWAAMTRPGTPSRSFTANLPAVDTTQPAQLTLWLIGYTDRPQAPDHRVEVRLNGVPLGELEWDGKQLVSQTYVLAGGVLAAGDNTLTLNLPGIDGVSLEGVWLDALELRYARGSGGAGNRLIFEGDTTARAYTAQLNSLAGLRAYDVTAPAAPQRLTNLAQAGASVTLGDNILASRRYALANDGGLLSPSRLRPVSPLLTGAVSGADYVLIAPAEFLPGLAQLAALRQSQGLIVAQEDVQAIYDAYGQGRPEPEAIRDFLAHTYAAWSPAPTYVLLVGDGTSDPRRYQANSSLTLIPPYLEDVDPWVGETAADNRYVMLDGADNLPDMLIGRLPANNLAELGVLVNKLVVYETTAYARAGAEHIKLFADNPDASGSFWDLSDAIASAAPATATVQSFHFNPPVISPAAMRATVAAEFNAGAGLLVYSGHSSLHQWADENFLHLSGVSGLNNGLRLPVLLAMTCVTGAFQAPGFETLDEAILRHPGGGAVAVWGATGLGLATGHELLGQGFLGALEVDVPTPVGAAALAAKLNLIANQPAYGDLLDTYNLLGDPATQLLLVTDAALDNLLYMPVISR